MNSNDLSALRSGARASGWLRIAPLLVVLVSVTVLLGQEEVFDVADDVVPSPSVSVPSLNSTAPDVGQVLIDPSLQSIAQPPASTRASPEVWSATPEAVVEETPNRTLRERIFDGEGWKDRPRRSERGRGRDATDVRFELDTEVVADDNILYSPAGEEVSDVIFRFTPGFFFGLGDEDSGAMAFVNAAYRPTASVFVDNDSENSVDHDVSLSFGGGGEKFRTSVDARYQTLSEASVDVGDRTDRQVVNADAVMEYAIGGKTGVRAELGYERADYDVLSDFDEWRTDLYATYAIGGKTSVGLGYGFGQLRPDAQGSQDYQRALARADWQATAKMAVAAWGGADFRKGDGADDTTAVFGFELTGDLREGTRIRLAAGRDIDASASVDTETYTLTRYGASIEQRIGERLTGVLEAGWEDYDYTGGGDLDGGRSDESLYLRPALRYRLRGDLTAEVFYAFRDSDSSIDPLDFESNQIGASAHYKF